MLLFKFQECEIRILQGRFTCRRSSLLQNAKLGMWTQEPASDYKERTTRAVSSRTLRVCGELVAGVSGTKAGCLRPFPTMTQLEVEL